MPEENTKSRPAAGLRTNQFIKALMEEGDFELYLITIGMPECYEGEIEEKEQSIAYKCKQYTISKNSPKLFSKIQKLHDEFVPDVIVGVNTYPSYVAAKIKSKAPFWADLNGWIMAEAQAQAYKAGNNAFLPHYYELEKTILKAADKISTVSENQKFAVYGELASLGRLNQKTFGYEFVHHIANGTEWFVTDKVHTEEIAWDAKIPKDGFVALWMGGYNTWVDEETLFKGLEGAMEVCPKLYFVSTGGEIKGLDDTTFERFKKLIDNSKHKGRFIFLGWIDTEEIPHLYKMAHCGLNVDRLCVETLTGARNRINEFMKFGLPIITTLGSEIAYKVKDKEAGLTTESGNSAELTRALQKLYCYWGQKEEDLQKMGKNGQTYAEEEANYKNLSLEFVAWIKSPALAGDKFDNHDLKKGTYFKTAWCYFRQNGFKKTLLKLRQRLRG